MYSKITHKIVEEHYSQPEQDEMTTDLPVDSVLPPAVMNESTMQFRMDSRSLWSRYAWNLLNYSISMNGGLPGTSQVESRLMKAASLLGDYITPYYGINAGNELGDRLAAIAKVGAEVVDAVKDRRSTEQFQSIWAELIDDLADFMNELNPSQWPEDLLKELFTELVSLWTKAIQSRYNEDWVGNEDALDGLDKLVITGIPNHVNKGYSSIADVFSRGIIAQYPSLFVR
jgi:hypothetical protein